MGSEKIPTFVLLITQQYPMRGEDAVFRGAESKDKLSKLHNSHKEEEFEDIKQV